MVDPFAAFLSKKTGILDPVLGNEFATSLLVQSSLHPLVVGFWVKLLAMRSRSQAIPPLPWHSISATDLMSPVLRDVRMDPWNLQHGNLQSPRGVEEFVFVDMAVGGFSLGIFGFLWISGVSRPIQVLLGWRTCRYSSILNIPIYLPKVLHSFCAGNAQHIANTNANLRTAETCLYGGWHTTSDRGASSIWT